MSTSKSCPLEKSKQLFPGINFFSNNDKKLVIRLNKIVDQITLEITTKKGGFYGINDISLIGLCDNKIDPLNFQFKLGLEKIIFRNKDGQIKYTKNRPKLERKRKEFADKFTDKVLNNNKGILLEPSSTFPSLSIIRANFYFNNYSRGASI